MSAGTVLAMIGGIALIILASVWLGGAVVLSLIRSFVKMIRWIVEPLTSKKGKKEGGDV